MAISFFAIPPQIVRSRGKKSLMYGSSLIRANQICEYLGEKYNPESGYENDIRIYVKNAIYRYKKFPGKAYLDIMDGLRFVPSALKRPDVTVISGSLAGCEYLKQMLPQEIIYIPQHHCNFERAARERVGVKVIGIPEVPELIPPDFPLEEMKKKLEDMGFLLVGPLVCFSREDVVDFYKKIDLQIVFTRLPNPLKQPLKIFNAASFGIPTVGCFHSGYKEAEGYYVRAESMDTFLNEIQKFADSAAYHDAFSEKIRACAEKYHISNIAEHYKDLDKNK